jgi:hypothetical protein
MEFRDQSAKFTGELPLALQYFSGLGLLSTHLITPTILRSFKLGEQIWYLMALYVEEATFGTVPAPSFSYSLSNDGVTF